MNTLVLTAARLNDCNAPSTPFRVQVNLNLPNVPGINSVTVIAGDGAMDVDQPGDGFDFKFPATSLAQLKGTLQGTWTIVISGASPSTTTFAVNARNLQDSDIFTCPTNVVPGTNDVTCPDVVFSWNLPESGPFPAYVQNEWIDFDLPSTHVDGPTNLVPFDPSITSWDPAGCVVPWPGFVGSVSVRFTSAYYDLVPTLTATPYVVVSGSIAWGNHPFAPRGYPVLTPLVAIGSETRTCFTINSCEPADLDCAGGVGASDLAILLGNWGSSGLGDLNQDGSVGAADLALLLGAWTG